MDVAAEAMAWTGLAILLAAAAITVADVLGRSVKAFTVPGLVDITQLLVMTGVSFMFPLTFLREANVSVDTFTERLGPKANRVILIVASVLGAALMGALTWFSAIQAAAQSSLGDRSQTAGIPLAYYWAPLLLGCAGGAVYAIVRASLHLLRMTEGANTDGEPRL